MMMNEDHDEEIFYDALDPVQFEELGMEYKGKKHARLTNLLHKASIHIEESESHSVLCGEQDSNTSDDDMDLESNQASSRFFPEADNINLYTSDNTICMECITAIEVKSRGQVKPGDHISFSGLIYDHHAIVVHVCDCKYSDIDDTITIVIVHATNTAAKATSAVLHPFGNKARLRKVTETINLKERKVFIFRYRSAITSKEPNDIVQRALFEAEADQMGHQGKFKYNLFENNCEHFATWCVTGRKLSIQVRKFTMVFWMFLKSGFYDISNEWIRNKKEYENGMLCETCYERNRKLLDIPHEYIDNSDDVNAGDVIIYSYYFLWHNAVVLRKLKSYTSFLFHKKYIECEIAHYAYLGPFKRRTISEETLSIPLDKTVMVLRYPEDKFKLFSQAKVVKRAITRIGEQTFSFFTNDSSQYSRWCKLKLNSDEHPQRNPSCRSYQAFELKQLLSGKKQSDKDAPENHIDKKMHQKLHMFPSIEEENVTKMSHTCLSDNTLSMECITPIEVESRHQIKPGDHISFCGLIYDHHAIIVGMCECYYDNDNEATIETVQATPVDLYPFGKKVRLKKVRETINLKERKVFVFDYRGGVKSSKPDEIVKRANSEFKAEQIGLQGKFKYNLFENNCKQFAKWCVTKRKLSI